MKSDIPLQVLKSRLEHGLGVVAGARGSLTKCTVLYGAFLREVRAGGGEAEEIERCKTMLETELKLYQVETKKTLRKLVRLQGPDMDELSEECAKLEVQIEATKKRVAGLQSAYPNEKQSRGHKVEYESLAKMANKREPSRVLRKKLSTLQEETEQLQESNKGLESQTQLRERQYHLLLQSILDMKASLKVDTHDDEDDGEEEGIVPTHSA
eukprot:CAMPEP_0194067488 /NCGR_PEP_ID=MMETSP0009_2-20130614/86587_1 /TAXON_ID=210454 /ORGANISM="Grammatophora oceanica, Strain CCMP 410" /LENGTH=210 /DNA_ID=CAMNT_0038720517 /DNA_START=126 /DNA_END=758 /DNA_ORIENTATION=+